MILYRGLGWLCLVGLSLAACSGGNKTVRAARELVQVATSDHQWTGVAVTREGRVFVNFPRWSNMGTFAVGEVKPDGKVVPYPDEDINSWDVTQPAEEKFVCVQSVYVDRKGFLWILDPANPNFRGIVEGGPKLVKVDPRTDKVIRILPLEDAVQPSSYLNDVRVDTHHNFAYLTDSGDGALVVIDLEKGVVRRVLDEHFSTQSEDVLLTVGASPWKTPDGKKPQIHADGIALSPDGTQLYYQALTGRNLYRIETRWLRDPGQTEEDLGAKVALVARSGAADGIAFGADGVLYLTAVEDDAIKALQPDGSVKVIIRDGRLVWPDSLANGADGSLYVTTSQIHMGDQRTSPYTLFRLTP